MEKLNKESGEVGQSSEVNNAPPIDPLERFQKLPSVNEPGSSSGWLTTGICVACVSGLVVLLLNLLVVEKPAPKSDSFGDICGTQEIERPKYSMSEKILNVFK